MRTRTIAVCCWIIVEQRVATRRLSDCNGVILVTIIVFFPAYVFLLHSPITAFQDCRTAAYALTDSVRTRGVNPCSDFYQFCCGLWNVSQQGLEDGGNHSGTYQQWLEDRYVAHVNTRMLELLKSKNTDDDDDRNDPSPRRVLAEFWFGSGTPGISISGCCIDTLMSVRHVLFDIAPPLSVLMREHSKGSRSHPDRKSVV